MTHEQDLFSLASGQQAPITEREATTCRRIPGEIVFEPIGSGIRVTARDKQHKVLWGYVGSKETVKKIHCQVAVYSTLQDALSEEIAKSGLPKAEKKDPMIAATDALNRLENTVTWLRESLVVKVVTGAALDRAREIARIISDADQQITTEAGILRGMKSRIQPDDQDRD